MFLIYRGLGILAPVLLFVITALVSLITNTYTHNTSYADQHVWVMSLGCLVGSVACWYAGKYLNGKPGRIVIDEQTGRRMEIKTRHSCFFIPFEYWAGVGVVISVVINFSH